MYVRTFKQLQNGDVNDNVNIDLEQKSMHIRMYLL